VFFEYDPSALSAVGVSAPVAVFAELGAAGYGSLLAYENTGEYLGMLDLADDARLRDIHAWAGSRPGSRYVDLCAFARDDHDVCLDIARSERDGAAETAAP
jgi:hypothetical protein